MKKFFIAILSVICILCVMPSIYIEASALTVSEELTILEAETIAKSVVASKTINESSYLYNFADEPKYIYVEFKEGGYAIFTSDNLEILECSASDVLPYNTSEKQYYGGPLSYFKKQNDTYINLLDKNNTFKNTPSYDEQPRIIAKSPGSSGATYISNAEYFYSKRPTYGTNVHGTCGSVAAQLLLSYNNYYNDRRIIAPEYLNGVWKKENNNGDVFNSSNYTLPSENPNVCYNPTDLNSKTGGTNEDFYRHIISYIDPGALECVCTKVVVNNTTGIATVTVTQNYADGTKSTTVSTRYAEPGEKDDLTHSHTGSPMNKVKEGIINVLEEANLGGVYEVYGYQSALGLTPASSAPIKNEINEDRPLIVGLGKVLGGLDHWAVAYGYQDYTYNQGTANEETYSGYVIHPGWSDDLTAMWVNEAWCFSFITLKLNHQHNYQIDTGNTFETSRELRCLDCGHRSLDELYNIDSDTNTLVSCNYELNGHITIPSVINGITINNIGTSAFANQTQLTSVTLPATVTSIGESAFSGCTNLTSINLGGAQTIGNYALQNCTSLTTISGLSGVVYIGELAFSNCSALTSIIIPNTISNVGAGAFAGCNNLVITSNSSNFVAEGNILYNSNKTKIITTGNIVSNIIIEDTVTEIGAYAFCDNKNLTELHIEGHPTIRPFAFCNLTNLQSIYFYSETPPYVEIGAFDNTTFSMYMPDGCEEAYYDELGAYADNVDEAYPIQYELKLVCSITGQKIMYANAYYLGLVTLTYVPNKEHYEFEGIYSQPNGQGIKYVQKASELNSYNHQIQWESTSAIWEQRASGTLYINWTRISSAISCNAVANNSIISKPTVQITSGVASTITAPSISGYNFSSWSVAGASYTTATITVNVTLHRSYNSGNITLAGTEHPSQDDFITIYYTEAPAEECVAEGTLITLADGRQVPVEQLTGNERLLVWNLKTGRFDSAPILFIDSEEAKVYDIINLYFSDGTHVKVISEHAFWDFDLNKYVYLREDASKYIGHYFNKQVTDKHGKMVWEKVQLTDVSITKEYTTAWSPVTEKHLCLYVNGMLSMPGGTEGLANTFEVNGRTMKIDRAKYRKDIKTYGVYTYEEFYELYPVPQEMFEAVDGQYLKVAIGKGLLTHEELTYLIQRYSKFFE